MDRAAPVWKRIVAFLLDLYFCLLATWAFVSLLTSELPNSSEVLLGSSANLLSPLAITLFLYASAFILLYHVFCEYIVGQTAGMLLVGLRVQKQQTVATLSTRSTKNSAARTTELESIGFWQAVGRNLFMIPILPFSLLWLADPLYYAFHGERLLEHWTKTETVA